MFSRLKFFYLVSFLIFFVSFLFSNDIRVTASVASQDVFLGEQLYYYVNIEGGSGSNIPEIKKLDNVDIYRVGNSVQMSLINGHMSTNVKITYILTPREEGKIIIPPVTVKTNKRTYSSNSVVINVIKNANQSSNNQNNIKNSNYNNQNYDNFVNEENEKQNQNQTKTTNKRNVFITSFVDKKSVYVNEPFILTFKVFTKVKFLSSPVFMIGETSGFWKDDLNMDKSYNTTYDGEEYVVIEKKYVLYPTIPGNLVISPSTLTCNIEDMIDEDNFFGISFFSRGREIKLTTKPIRVQVKEFPVENKPEFFDGALGNFTLEATYVKDKYRIDAPINVNINIQGEGNINTISPPKFYHTDNYKIYDPIEKIDLKKTDRGLSGQKKFEVMIVPLVSGKQNLPKIKFAFFNHKLKKYVVLEKDLGEINVENVRNTEKNESSHLENFDKKSELKLLNGDIRFIHRNTKLIVNNKNRDEIFTLKFWIIFFIPIFIYFSLVLLEHFSIFHFGNKKSFSGSIFNKNLKEIKKNLAKKNDKNDYQEFVNKLLDIFIKYINYEFSSKLDLNNLSINVLNENLDISDDIKKKIREILDIFYYNKFANVLLSKDEIFLIIEKLEKLKKELDNI